MKMQALTDDGWVTIEGTAGPIEFQQSEWGSEVRNTIRSFSTSVNFDFTPEVRRWLTRYGKRLERLATVNRAEYRRRTRRRNRRRR